MLRSSFMWESLLKGLPAGLLVLLPLRDEDGSLADFEVLAANPAALRLLGTTEYDLLGGRLGAVHPNFRQRSVLNSFDKVLGSDAAGEFEQLLPETTGSSAVPGWYELTLIPADGRIIMIMDSISKRKSVLREAVRMMNVDDLTGIGNRRLLKSHFWRQRQQDGGMALIFLDLNGFKRINDTYGHETGDEVLKIIAQRIRNSVRPDEAIARMGGDEFAVLLDTGDRAAAESVAGRLREAIARPISLAGNHMELSTSLGIACFPEDGRSFEALSAAADSRMYLDKNRRAEASGDVAAQEQPPAEAREHHEVNQQREP